MGIRLVNALGLMAAIAIGLSAADNSIGTWKRNVEKSKYTPAARNRIKSQIMVREAVDGGVKVTTWAQRADGTPVNANYTVKYDGTPASVSAAGSLFDTVSTRQIDANTFMLEMKRSGGKYHTTGRMVISKDGKTMTMTLSGTDGDGKPVSNTLVWDRQ